MSIADKESVLGVLAEVPATLRALVEDNVKLASRLEVYEKKELAEQIVTQMDEKGLGDPDLTFQEKVASLLDSGKELDQVKLAVDLATPNFSFASLSDSESDSTTLEDYILGLS